MAAYRCLLTLWTLLQRMRRCVPLLIVALFSVACATEPMRAQSANDCDDFATVRTEAGHPLRLPNGAPLLADEFRQLPSSSDMPWFADSRQATEIRTRKYLIGDDGSHQERSPIYGGAVPRMPPNAICLIQDVDLQLARKGASALGKQLGVAMASCDVAMESLNNRTDHHAAAWQRPDAKMFERVLNNCVKDLLAVQQMPDYEDSRLLGATQAAFEKGVELGIDEVYHRIIAIEVAATLIEIAFIEAAPLIELALLRSVRRAMVLLREMPVLVPLAVDVAATDAAGGVMILMKVPRPIAKGSSVALRRNIIKAKRPPPLPGEFTHHIAAHGDSRAKLTVEILERFGIHVDDEVNGVFLPGYKSSPNPLGKVVHGNLHTNAYYAAVERRLQKAVTRADVEQALRKIAYELEHGIIPK